MDGDTSAANTSSRPTIPKTPSVKEPQVETALDPKRNRLVEASENSFDPGGKINGSEQKGLLIIPQGNYTLLVGPWGPCSNMCEMGFRERSILCVDRNLTVQTDLINCRKGLVLPKVEPCGKEDCNQFNVSLDFSMDPLYITVWEPYSGTICEFEGNCQGMLTTQGECCRGVLDVKGRCCSGHSVLDAVGECCGKESLDACGVCNGEAKAKDKMGTCCKTLKDAWGGCCLSGVLDECGICDGDNSSCAKVLSLEIGPLEEKTKDRPGHMVLTQKLRALMEEILKEIIDELDVSGVEETEQGTILVSISIIGTPLSSKLVTAKLIQHIRSNNATRENGEIQTRQLLQESSPLEVRQIFSATSVSICGNSFCEFGESESCPADCPGVPFNPPSCMAISSGSDCKNVFESCENRLLDPAQCLRIRSSCQAQSVGDSARPCLGNGLCLPSGCECFAGYSGDHCGFCAMSYVPFNNHCIRMEAHRATRSQESGGDAAAPQASETGFESNRRNGDDGVLHKSPLGRRELIKSTANSDTREKLGNEGRKENDVNGGSTTGLAGFLLILLACIGISLAAICCIVSVISGYQRNRRRQQQEQAVYPQPDLSMSFPRLKSFDSTANPTIIAMTKTAGEESKPQCDEDESGTISAKIHTVLRRNASPQDSDGMSEPETSGSSSHGSVTFSPPSARMISRSANDPSTNQQDSSANSSDVTLRDWAQPDASILRPKQK
ncbi:hypothetical protein BSKO_02040 [Bryopsis sp. KO-2023]|nr:hypothetical protein BSKO_02040 [Bryopsis sp. KO-2023]